MGGEFAANLTRLGEKAITITSCAGCTTRGSERGPTARARSATSVRRTTRGTACRIVFDLDHSTCPNDGSQLQVQNMTVMPSLRLSAGGGARHRHLPDEPEARRRRLSRRRRPTWTIRGWPTQGRVLVSRYGCASCHEIRGLEDAPRIGTELTKEASKPIEQLDFGLLEHKAKKEGWYTHKGFFEHKLENPAVYDQGREKAPEDRLRMPNIELATGRTSGPSPRSCSAAWTLRSAASSGRSPSSSATSRPISSRDIQEGWWVVKKYNCMGCHDIQVGQKSVFERPAALPGSGLERAAAAIADAGRCARRIPEWLARFPGESRR